jgi:tRNA (guanine-N7-)-methyltransferase
MYEQKLREHPDLEPAGDEEGSPLLAENPYNARSPREHRAIEDGLPIHRLRFKRKPRPISPA